MKRSWHSLSRVHAHELGRPHARLGNPNTGIPEVVVQPIYDVYAVAAANTIGALTLFSVQQGQIYNFFGATFTKGQGHTNLVQAGMLQSSYTFIVRALGISVSALQGTAHPLLHPEDLINFLYSYMEFDINSKPYFQGIGAWLPAGGGPYMGGGFGSLTAPASSQVTTNGVPSVDNIYSIPGGQYINPQETFSFQINPTINAGGTPSTLAAAGNPTGVPASGLMAWVRLDGTLIRVAQ